MPELKLLSTKEFVSYFPNSVFQTFHDTDKTNPRAAVHLKYDEQLFKKLNSEGFGIFISANAFDGGRTLEHLTRLTAAYCDADIRKVGDALKDKRGELKKKLFVEATQLELPPNIIIVTANGCQPLWLIDEPPTEADRFVRSVKGIIEKFKTLGSTGDKVQDVARVVRLPGYNHCKEEPYPVQAFLIHETKTNLSELERAFPFFDEEEVDSDNAKTFREVSALDSVSMQDVALAALREYGEPSAYFDKSGRLVTSRGATGAFLGKKNGGEFIGSTSHEIPSGNKITFVQKLLKLNSNSDAYAWIRKEFGLVSTKQKVSEQKESQVIEDIKSASWISYADLLDRASEELLATVPEEVVDYGYNFLNNSLGGIFPGELILVGAVSGTGKTTFVSRIAAKIAQNHKVGEIILEDRLNDYALKNLYFELNRKKQTRYNWIHFRKNMLDNPKYREELSEAKKRLANSNISILEYRKSADANILCRMIEEKHKADGTKIFILDHLHMLDFGDTSQSKERQLEEAMKSIVKLKDELGISIIMVAHLRKTKESEYPTMTDFKDAMAIPQCSNTVILLWRDRSSAWGKEDYDSRPTKFIIPKARMGLSEFSVEVRFDKNTGDYEDVKDEVKGVPVPAEGAMI